MQLNYSSHVVVFVILLKLNMDIKGIRKISNIKTTIVHKNEHNPP